MDTNSIILYGVGIIALINTFFVIKTELRLKKLLSGKGAKDLEGQIVALGVHAKTIEEEQEKMVAHITSVDKKLAKTIRGVQTLRFNPFTDSGSNQSFATAFLNDEGDGVVISSLYARERVSVFAKPIEKGKPVYELSEEEAVVLSRAKK